MPGLKASKEEVLGWAKPRLSVVGLLDGIVESSTLFEVMEDLSFALNPKGAGGRAN